MSEYEGKRIVSPPGFREDPRFICRREGHDPEFVMTKSTVPIASLISRCKRCGCLVETSYTETRPE